MHLLPTSVILLLAACSSAAVEYSVDEVVGHYQWSSGIDTWEELDLMPGGACIWWSCSAVGGVNKAAIPGRWMVGGGRIVITGDPGSLPLLVGATQLTVRRLDGHIYLVPAFGVEWFDSHGPDRVFCFHTHAALLAGALRRRTG